MPRLARTKDYAWRPRANPNAAGAAPLAVAPDRPPPPPGEPVAPRIARPPDCDLMLFRTYGQACSPCTASLPAPRRRTPARQSRRPHRGPDPSGGAGAAPSTTASSAITASMRSDRLLRPPRPLAARRDRARHRPHAPDVAPQDRPRRPAGRPLSAGGPLQQHPPQVPRYQTPAEVFWTHVLHLKWNPPSGVRRNDDSARWPDRQVGRSQMERRNLTGRPASLRWGGSRFGIILHGLNREM